MRHILSGALGGGLDTGITGELIQTLRLIESKHGADAMLNDPHLSNDQFAHAYWSLLKLNPLKQRGYIELLGTHYPGIECYYPRYTRIGRPHGVRKAREMIRPVYPGYVFLRIRDQDVRGPVSLPVSARWVRFGGKIEAIPGYVVERLRKLEVADELVREVRYVNPYSPGVRVMVHLPVQDIRAVVVKLVGHNRCVVDTPLCRVTVPIHTLQVM